jgi:hypothetical protein
VGEDRRTAILEPIELGLAEFVPDPRRPAGWTLLVDDVAQSYVDLDRPRHLEFPYVRLVAALVDVAARRGAPLDVLHLGGGGLTLPRYVAATRPGSRQRVIERDATLAGLVRRILPLPQRAGIELEIADARTAVEETPDASYDLVICDVYRAAAMPRAVAAARFAAHAARILRPGGLYAVNVTDAPALTASRRQAAGLCAAFHDVCVVAEPGTLRGRRFGNVVLAAATAPGHLPVARLVTRTAGIPGSGRLLHGEDLTAFVAGAAPPPDA